MEHHIFLPQQLFQLLEQGGVEQAPGPQPALGVGQIEHGGLLAGEEDKEVAYPGEQGIVAPGKAQIELPGEGSGSAGRFRDLLRGVTRSHMSWGAFSSRTEILPSVRMGRLTWR